MLPMSDIPDSDGYAIYLSIYRSLDGTGMFNWRFIFPFNYLPQERLVHVERKEHLWSLDKTVTKFPPVVNIQVWDNDLFGPNEYISEWNVSFFSLKLNETHV